MGNTSSPPGYVTYSDILLASKQAADMVNSNFITDAEWKTNINRADAVRYDLLVTTYGEDFQTSQKTPYSFTTDGTNDRYPLPGDFYKGLGAQMVVLGGIINGAITMKMFTRGERNFYTYPFAAWPLVNGSFVPKYRFDGNFIWLRPTPPPGGINIVVDYVPRRIYLSDVCNVTLTSLREGDQFVLQTTAFVASVAGGVAPNFAIGASDAESATNLAAAVNALFGPDQTNGILSATASTNVVTLTPLGGLPLLTYSATLATPATPQTFTTYSAPFCASRISVDQQGVWTNVFDGVSGWEDLTIIGAALKAVTKEQTDASQLAAEYAEIKQRIIDSAPNRDAVGTATGSDTADNGSGWGGSNGPGFNGGWYGGGY